MYDMKICLFKNELNANVYLVLYRLLSGLDLSSLKIVKKDPSNYTPFPVPHKLAHAVFLTGQKISYHLKDSLV